LAGEYRSVRKYDCIRCGEETRNVLLGHVLEPQYHPIRDAVLTGQGVQCGVIKVMRRTGHQKPIVRSRSGQ